MFVNSMTESLIIANNVHVSTSIDTTGATVIMDNELVRITKRGGEVVVERATKETGK